MPARATTGLAFERFVDLFYTQKRVADAFADVVSDDYRQHNPTIPDGPAAAIERRHPKVSSASPYAVASRCSASSSTATWRWCT